ncbi:ROK family protein [Companilactobacillus huachuanensis]|uniref:ROK family protein n=1 Tax=Companilactobacillus huachuanensis TaxID=2559914 RepID=A0ABW1RQC4_9LACO|nr:ROK family protein [Companilactobacillus huachuanensis]
MENETILSVDLGGTKILIGEVSADGKVLTQKKYHSDVSSQSSAYEGIRVALKNYFATSGSLQQIRAISISAVGRINEKNGDWFEIDPTKAEHIELAQKLSKEFKLPVYAANDVYCATEAELMLGIGNVTKNFIYLNIGTGIAGRMVINGEIINGKHFDAGEIGHMVVDMNSSVKCICGRYGCVEPLASGLGMSNRAKDLLSSHPNSQLSIDASGRIGTDKLFAAYDKKDPVAVEVVGTALKGIATLVMNMVRVTDPEAIILGGGVTNDGWLLRHLDPLLENQSTMRFISLGVKNSSLDPNLIALRGAGLHGFSRLEE